MILDLSVTLPVARKLVYYPQAEARRCSVFLNPSGSDLVLLCRDKARRGRLDWLEFQYSRELVSNVGSTRTSNGNRAGPGMRARAGTSAVRFRSISSRCMPELRPTHCNGV